MRCVSFGKVIAVAGVLVWPLAAGANPSARPAPVQSQPLPAPAASPAQQLSTAAPAVPAEALTIPAAGTTLSDDPLFGPETLDRTLGALRFYEGVIARGGWMPMPVTARGMKIGHEGPLATQLRARLAMSGDLDASAVGGDTFDATVEAALKRFQFRHGLTETGAIGRLTFAALNVPAETRLIQLRASIDRLRNNAFRFSPRYVVVNIPGAAVEAIANNRVERRHRAVVGRKERPSPVLSTRITSVNVNPTWTVPNSIIKGDIMPAVTKDPWYLYKNNLRVLNGQGQELDPNSVDWSGKKPVNFTLRQDPGPANSLGQIKIDMPNGEAVYLHDTPKKELFRSDVRFHSSGCARVADVRDLAAWLLAEQGVDRSAIDLAIEAGQRQDFKLAKPVPVAWVYLTAWGDGTGNVQFREDIYGLDTPDGIQQTTLSRREQPSPIRVAAPSTPAPPAYRPAALADPVSTGSVSGRTSRASAVRTPLPTPRPAAPASQSAAKARPPSPQRPLNLDEVPLLTRSAPMPVARTASSGQVAAN
jgi:hypothetical protein